MNLRHALASTTLLLLTLPACAGKAAPSDGAQGQDEAACSWPSDLNPPSSTAGWAVARYYNICQDGEGGEGCLSSTPTCPDDTTVAGATSPTHCVDQCASTEYAVAIGGLPNEAPSASPNLPSGCHSAGLTPESSEICCPCE